MEQREWDRGTRWLHGALSLTVTFQLFVSLVMQAPRPGSRLQPLQLLGFRAHEAVGVALVFVVLAHWAWSLSRGRGEALRHLLPWGAAGRAEIAADLRNLKGGKLPAGGPGGGLAGLVHGLGLLAVTGMAALGAWLVALSFVAPRAPLLLDLADVHGAFANLVWLYWLGHIAMVVVHERRGHRILAGIFRP